VSTSAAPTPGRTRRFVDAIKVGYVSQAVLMVAGLLLTPFILSHIGQHDYGLWLVGLQITTYLIVLDLGVVALLPRDVAYASHEPASDARADADDLTAVAGRTTANDLTALVGRATTIVLAQLPLVAIVAGVVWLLLPREWQELHTPLGIILITFVAFFPTRVFQAVLTGLQDQAFVGWAQLAGWLTGTALSTLLVLDGRGLISLAAGWTLTQAVQAIACWWRLRARHPGVLPNRLSATTWRESRAYLGNSVHVSVAQIAQSLVLGTDVLIIGKVLGPAAVVPYALTGKLINLLSNQPQLFVHVALPGMAQLRASEGGADRLSEVTSALQLALLIFSGFVVCLVLLVNGAFLRWWVGPDQFGGVTLTALLTLVMALRHWNLSAVVTRFALGDERRISYVTLGDGLLSVGAGVLLVRLIGPVGAPIGALAGVCLVSLPKNLTAVSREMHVPLATLLAPAIGWMKRLVPLSVALASLSLVWPPATVVGLAAASFLALAACAVAAWPVVRRSALAPYAEHWLAALRWPLVPRAAETGD
jgi:O-antigen/teichoic acid export membrane protein